MKTAISVILSCLIFTMCATAEVKNQKYDIAKYSSKSSVYDRYLVSLDSYTTIGSVYHKKYEETLYGIAKIFIDEKKFVINDKTIGFYYDKKENRKDRLFFGADFNVSQSVVSDDADYEKNVRSVLKNYLLPSMEVMHSCPEVLNENDVKGIVFGYIWERSKRKELVNIWITKEDLVSYFKNDVTLTELVIRSVVTNTEGRIFRISL
jgi:hypothetical protein